ncbi:MAG: 2-hydroxyacyl-CoA dehydratase [Deltaproteobacteria bacterium]|nr:2-hydroxyacyl-CoA dehydratase [Deltaproteobacteria bacterium]
MQLSELIDSLKLDPLAYATGWKKNHSGKVVGYMCSYAPEEIIWAFGALPFRLMGTKSVIDRADAHLQAYCCSLVRGSLEDALTGRLDFLDGMVFPHTCDSIQRLSDIWRINVKNRFHADVVLPAKLDSDSASDYLVATFRKLITDLENRLGRSITEKMLGDAADLYNEIRSHLNTLYVLRQAHPRLINGSDFHAIVQASMWMDRNDFCKILSDIVGFFTEQATDASFQGKRIVLSGGVCNVPDIYPAIEAAGAAVVGEDVCTGDRFFQGSIRMQGDMVENIARRYIDRIVCPAKHHGLFTRGNHLIQKVRETRADGVIFLFLKFCDPHGFDYPYVKEMLDQEGIPSMVFEIEDRSLSEGQFKTRCEAFIEML